MALDVGEKRIGVALADTSIAIAIPYDTIAVDGTEIEQIVRIVQDEAISTIVVGYPRNQSGDVTEQTAYVESFVEKLPEFDVELVYQDESLTSVHAEERLKSQKAPYTKGDIDKIAASIILQDYLEQIHGRI